LEVEGMEQFNASESLKSRRKLKKKGNGGDDNYDIAGKKVYL
jgi:hypothetical protein